MLRIWIQLGLALLVGASASMVQADEGAVDSVVLFDVSSEMDGARVFDSARALLLDLIPYIARPGAQVAIVPFGEGAHTPIVVRIPHDRAGAAAARSRLRAALDEARANDRHRYLYAAIERGLEQLGEFAKRQPQRERRLVILSLGARSVSSSESALPLADRIARHAGPGMTVGRDWSLWYGYYRDGDPALRQFIADRGAGSSIALDDRPRERWGVVALEWPVLELGAKTVGEWKQVVSVVGSGPAGTTLNLQAGVGPASNGATITVTPAQIRLTSDRQTFQLELSGFGRAGSNYDGAWLRCDAAGSRPVWVNGARVAILAGASRARVGFESGVIEIDRVDRGTRIKREFDLLPNAEAKQRRCVLRFEAVDLPPDVSLVVEPAEVRLDELQRVTVVLAALAGARPGRFESRILVKAEAGLTAEQREIAVRYEVGRGGVRIVQSRLVAPPLVRGGDVLAKLTLVPDDGAVEAGASIRVEVGDLPEGLEVEVLRKFVLHEETDLTIRLRSPASTPDGVLRTELRFSAQGEIRVVPSVIPVEVQIIAAPPIPVGGRVELGRLYRSCAGRITASIPIEVDRVHHGTLLEFVPASDSFRITPDRQRLTEGKQNVEVVIEPNSVDPGPTNASFRVYSLRSGERSYEGEYTVAWTVLDSFLRIVRWRAPPALTVGANLVTAKLTIEASPDLAGQDVDLKMNFGSLPAGTQFAAGFDSFRLQGGAQSVTLPIDIVRSAPGQYPGTLELEMHQKNVDLSQLRRLPFSIDVPTPPLAAELLDPEKQRKMLVLGGVLVLVFIGFAFLFRFARSRSRPRVEFELPKQARRELNDRQANEVRSAFEDHERF